MLRRHGMTTMFGNPGSTELPMLAEFPAAYSAPLTILVLRNAEYAILKWFADVEGVAGAPGLDLPELSCVAVSDGYGVPAREVTGGREELVVALREAIGAEGPRLIETPVAPGMWLT